MSISAKNRDEIDNLRPVLQNVYLLKNKRVKTMTLKEKRKHLRINSLNLSYIFVDGNNNEERQTIGRTLNVSESGILLETHIPVDLNDNLILTMGLKEDLVDIKGKVVHLEKGKHGMYELGVKFLDADKKATRILQKYIEAFNDKQKKME